MKKVLGLVGMFGLFFLLSSFTFADVWVNGYFRKDGTYTEGHYRTDPDGVEFNNRSYYEKNPCPNGRLPMRRESYNALMKSKQNYIKGVKNAQTKYGLVGINGQLGLSHTTQTFDCYYPVDTQNEFNTTENTIINLGLKGLNSYKQGKYQETINYTQKAMNLPNAQIYKGYKEVKELFDMATHQQKLLNSNMYYQLAKNAYNNKNYQSAIELLKKSLSFLDKSNPLYSITEKTMVIYKNALEKQKKQENIIEGKKETHNTENKTTEQNLKEKLGEKASIIEMVVKRAKQENKIDMLKRIIPVFKNHKKQEIKEVGEYLELLLK